MRHGDEREEAGGEEEGGGRDQEPDFIECESNDAAFLVGKGGSTKAKLERVSGAHITLDEDARVISLTGSARQRQLARDYIDFVMQQRRGAVHVDLNGGRDDMTALTVPSDCVAFVMGRSGQTLRMMEAEWGTLMFFGKGVGSGSEHECEMLMIFGPLRNRRGAEMKVMSAVEHKVRAPSLEPLSLSRGSPAKPRRCGAAAAFGVV